MSTLLNRFGDYLLEKALASECKQAGLVSASTQISFGNVEYLRSENEAKHSSEAIVMLHGAAADKTSWTRFAKYLGSKFPLVIPDLPGHGKSIADINLNYSEVLGDGSVLISEGHRANPSPQCRPVPPRLTLADRWRRRTSKP